MATNNLDAQLAAVLADSDILIDRERWLTLLQDSGRDLTPDECSKFLSEDAGRKVKAHHILHGSRFYKGIYSLAELVYDNIALKREEHFQELPTGKNSKTSIIHAIGKTIASSRRSVDRNQALEGEFRDLIEQGGGQNGNHIFMLAQQSVLAILVNRYAVKDVLKVTVDDKVRLAGIMLNNDYIRDKLDHLSGKSLGSNHRPTMDSSKSEKSAAMKILLNHFVDEDVVVTLPPKWLDPNTADSIDNLLGGPGVFAAHGMFNPNNLTRMKLPWTEKEIAAILAALLKEYFAMMEKYTKGTGGGSGAPELFAAWQGNSDESQDHDAVWKNRDERQAVTYTTQRCNIYLSVVLMWDKAHGYKLSYAGAKGTMPKECGIDDSEDHIASDADAASTSGMTTPRPTSSLSMSSAKGKKNTLGIAQVMEKLSDAKADAASASREMSLASNEIIKVMHGFQLMLPASGGHNVIPRTIERTGGGEQKLDADAIVACIATNKTTIDGYELTLNRLKTDLKAARESLGSEQSKAKRARKIKEEIQETKQMLKSLKNANKLKREDLDKATKMDSKCADSDDDSDSDIE